MQGQLVTSSTALEGPQDEPGGRVVQDVVQDSALQGDRRAPSTVAVGNEPPMKGDITNLLGAR
jgi:hypothetical protein